jgi:hypothetical protein
MTCDKAKEFFSELNEGTLNEGLRLKLLQHLHECASCQHEFDSFRNAMQAFAALSPVSVPDDLGELIARRLDRIEYDNKLSRQTGSRWLRYAALGTAAAALIAAIVMWKPNSETGVPAGLTPRLSTSTTDVRVERVDGEIRIRFDATEDTQVSVFEGGHDYSALPPIDGKQLRIDKVGAGSRYDVPIKISGILPQALWLKLGTSKETVGVFFPQPGAQTAREFNGNTVHALQAIANGFGVVVEAHLLNAGAERSISLQGEDALAAAQGVLEGSLHKNIRLTNGVLRIR